MSQKFSNLGELQDIVAGFPGAANPLTHIDKTRINEMAIERIFSLGRKFIRRRIGQGTAG